MLWYFLNFCSGSSNFFLYFYCCCPWALFEKWVCERMETDVRKNSTCWILKNKYGMIIKYWHSSEQSIKRCACVNKRKNSGSRWTRDNYITRCPRRFESVGDKMLNWEPVAVRGLWTLSDPRLSNPAKMRKKYCWLNIAVCPCLHSPLTHRNINPFENKVWEVYFYKELYPFVHWSSSILLTMFPPIFVLCICICVVVLCGYTTRSVYDFFDSISTKRNVNCFVQVLNSSHRYYFLRQLSLR